MRVYTRVEIDILSGKVLDACWHEYAGPLALCDRQLTAQGEQAAKGATATAGQLGGQAAGIYGNLVPRLESEAVNPQGFGPFGLAQMETAAESTAAGATGAAQERARLNAMRTNNAAGLGSTEAAAAQGGARAAGSAVQGILAQNAQLKAQQQLEANKQLGGILGEETGAQVQALGIVPKDLESAVAAENVGWVQDTKDIMEGLGALGRSSQG